MLEAVFAHRLDILAGDLGETDIGLGKTVGELHRLAVDAIKLTAGDLLDHLQDAAGVAMRLAQAVVIPALNLQQITQHGPGADGGQLLGVAHEYHMRPCANGGHHRFGDLDVVHGTLIHPHDIALQRVFAVVAEAPAFRPHQGGVNGVGLDAIGVQAVAEHLGRLAGRPAEDEILVGQDLGQDLHQLGLAATGTCRECVQAGL